MTEIANQLDQSHKERSVDSNFRVCLDPKDALNLVLERFPFKNYIDPSSNSHLSTASCVRRHLSPRAKILDFGSGPCDKTGVLQAMGFECSALDDLQDAWHLKGDCRTRVQAFAEDAGIHFTLARPGSTGFTYPKEHFDMVVLNDVVEHLHDSPRELLNDLLELVAPNGLMLITVPNAGNIRKRLALLCGGTNYQRFDTYYWYPGKWRGHVREYVKSDLLRLSDYLNVEVLELHGCDQMLSGLAGLPRAVYLGVTNVLKGWKDTWILVARKRPGWMPRKDLAPGAILSKPVTYLYGE
jgi:2-polyprenyl-3-methyl-5-hydroxy-6-metoxy-1,4-benzoquinol methylase